MHSEVNVNQSNYPLKHWLGIAWRLFVREFGRGELTIIFLSIVLAVSSVMALSSVTDRVEKAIMSKSAAFIAADRDLRSAHPIEDEITQYAKELGLETDKHVYFNSMAFAGDEMNIAVIKAVTETYPLKGNLFVTKSLNQAKIEVHGPPLGEVWMSKRLFYALSLSEDKLASGEPLTIEIGEGFFNVAGIITDEPDAPFEVFNSGTRIIMNIKDVEKTNVVQPGSRISYRDLFAGDEAKLNEFTAWLEPQLKPNQRIRDVKEGATGISSALTRAESFLMLAGVLGVLLAATAVAVATRLYSQRHFDSIAIFKTLGASIQQVRVVYLFQLVLIALVSILVGIVIGSLMQLAAVELMAQYLPDELPAIGYKPVLMAVLTGFVCALMFSIPSLLKLFSIPPLRVLRRNLGDDLATSWTARVVMALTTVLLVAIYSQNLMITAIVMVAGVALTAVITLVARLMIHWSRKVSANAGNSASKIAMASLKRRAKENTSQLIGFTLAIMLILILYSLKNSIIKEWQQQIPVGTPNHFVINIAQHDLDDVKAKFAEQGVEPEQYYPIIRGRLTAINGEVVSDDNEEQNNTGAKHTGGEGEEQQSTAQTESQTENQEQDSQGRQGVGRELNLTFSEQLAANNKVLEGEWMAPDRGAQVSIEKEIAERLQVGMGDTLTFLIGAKEVEAKVTSIREVDWNSFQPNFFMVFNNEVLNDFPATYITSFYLPKEQKLWVNDLLRAHPTLSVIDVEAMIEQIQQVIEQVSVSIQVVLFVVVCAATLVLLAQVQSSLDERRRETVVYRTLGAKGKTIQNAITIEFLSLGAISGIIAAIVAEVSLFMLQWQMFEMDWQVHWELWLIGPLSGALFVALVGNLSTRSLMRMTPNQLIRQLS
jgi:putative ABC transport system permease protein